MNILNPNAFVLTRDGQIGLANRGVYASDAWLVSDRKFKKTMGTKFSWTRPDGINELSDRDRFSRPTPKQIVNLITQELKDIAIVRGYLSLT